jgi:FtsZ-interacting cell division protein ZipA
MDLSNPIVLIIGGIALLALLYFWNKYNTGKQRNRKKRSFRNNYYERKKDRAKNENS